MLKNLEIAYRTYDCCQLLRGFKNCINHFSRCPSAENMPEMLQPLKFLHHTEKFGKSHTIFYGIKQNLSAIWPNNIWCALLEENNNKASHPPQCILHKQPWFVCCLVKLHSLLKSNKTLQSMAKFFQFAGLVVPLIYQPSLLHKVPIVEGRH